MKKMKRDPLPHKFETKKSGTLYRALGFYNTYINSDGMAFRFNMHSFIGTGEYIEENIEELNPLTTHDGRTVYFVESMRGPNDLIEPLALFDYLKKVTDVLDNPNLKMVNTILSNHFIDKDANIYKLDDLETPVPIEGPDIRYIKNEKPINFKIYRDRTSICNYEFAPIQFRYQATYMEIDPYKTYALKFLGLPYKKVSHLAYIYFYYNDEEDNNARMTYTEEYVIHKDIEEIGRDSYKGEKGEYCGDQPLTENRLQLFHKNINMTKTRVHLLKYYPGYACLYDLERNTYKIMRCDTGNIVPYFFNEDGLPTFRVFVGDRSPYKDLTGYVPLNKLHVNPGKLNTSTFKLPAGKGKDIKR